MVDDLKGWFSGLGQSLVEFRCYCSAWDSTGVVAGGDDSGGWWRPVDSGGTACCCFGRLIVVVSWLWMDGDG